MINRERLLTQFLEYVQIDSESRHEKAMADRLVSDLQAMGLQVRTDHAGEMFGSDGYNVIAKLEGDGTPILLSAHIDTVTPGRGVKPYVKDGVVYSDGTTILGSDDKSGVCGIMEALRVIVESGMAHRAAEIVFSVGEEVGLYGAKALDLEEIKSKKGFIFDASGDVGRIIVSAPGQINLRARVIGRSAHAGNAPEKGISAIAVLAHAIARMNLLRIDEETTCNIGTIRSEYPTNIVPAQAEMIAEVRSRSLKKLEAQAEHMRACLQETCDEMGAQLECTMKTNYVSYRFAPENETVRMAVQALERIGVQAQYMQGGGGSDANVYNQKGLESIVLGTGMTDVHTTAENITLENLEKTAQLALSLLQAEKGDA